MGLAGGMNDGTNNGVNNGYKNGSMMREQMTPSIRVESVRT